MIRKSLAGIWLFLVVGVCLLAWLKGPNFESSIMALLPLSEQNPHAQTALDKQSEAFAQRLTILVQGDDESDTRQIAQAIRAKLLASDQLLKEDNLAQASSELLPKAYRYVVLSEQTRQRLQQQDTLQQSKSDQAAFALNQIFNPVASTPIDLVNDPFALYAGLLQEPSVSGALTPQKGLLRASKAKQATYVLFYSLQQNAYALSTQEQLMPILEALRSQAKAKQVTMQYSGLVVHAAYGAKQAKAEISTIGIGSLMGIIALIWWVFRRFLPFVYILLPVAVGCTAALAGTVLIFPTVHLITFAFGAGLVGVAVDYSMHYVCSQNPSQTTRLPRALLISLALGLVSSVLAYAGLALTPFPGLRQIAVFSALGLIGSWVTVVCWLPLCNIAQRLTLHSSALNAFTRYAVSEASLARKYATPLLLLFAVISLIGILRSVPNDGLAQLQTSPASLIAEDRHVQATIGQAYQSAFLLQSGANIEAVLQQEETLRVQLDALRQQGLLDQYQAISQSLPSLARQRENLDLVKALYQHSLDSLYRTIGASQKIAEQANQALDQATDMLTFDTWQHTPIGQALSAQMIAQEDGQYSSIIQFIGPISPAGWQALHNLADNHDQLSLVDPVGQIDSTLARYRQQLSQWLLLAYLVVTLILFWRYRWQLWHIMLPPIVASAMAFALACTLNHGYNLFNLVALMLVFGIGLDMGIFVKESQGDAHTWLAVSLSSLTSLLAFGLLVLSNTPVLYHFGIIVLPGLLIVWLVTPLVQPISHGENRNE